MSGIVGTIISKIKKTGLNRSLSLRAVVHSRIAAASLACLLENRNSGNGGNIISIQTVNVKLPQPVGASGGVSKDRTKMKRTNFNIVPYLIGQTKNALGLRLRSLTGGKNKSCEVAQMDSTPQLLLH